MVEQLSIIAAIAIIITVVLSWTSNREKRKREKHALIEPKIVIGFYQVTHGLL